MKLSLFENVDRRRRFIAVRFIPLSLNIVRIRGHQTTGACDLTGSCIDKFEHRGDVSSCVLLGSKLVEGTKAAPAEDVCCSAIK